MADQPLSIIESKPLPLSIVDSQPLTPPLSLVPGTPGSSSGLVHDWAESGANVLGGMANAALHPIYTAKNLGTVAAGLGPDGPPGSWQHDVAKPAAEAVGDAYKEKYGSPSAAGHTLLHDPFGAAADIGAIAAPAEGMLRGGAALADASGASGVANAARAAADISGIAQTATNPLSAVGSGIGWAGSKLLGIRSGLSPVESAAVDYAIADPALGKTVDAATATGNKFLTSSKSLLRKFPTSAGVVGDAENAQRAAITGKMGSVADSVSPGGSQYKFPAGQGLQAAIDKKLTEYGTAASAAYKDVIARAEANPVKVQTGTKSVPSTMVDQYGNPMPPTIVPVFEDIAGPTSTADVKAAAAPILAQLETELPEAAKQSSPTISLLRQIMNRPDMVSIETAIADNSAIQNVARTEVPQMRSKLQSMTSKLVSPYRAAIDDAANSIDPAAYQALEYGRTATRAKYDLGQSIPAPYPKQMRGKPVDMVNLLTKPQDAQVMTLQKLQQHVPNAIPDVARSTLESIFRPTIENGEISKIDSALNKWNALGPKTKELLFGKDTTEEVTNLLHYTKLATKESNPSGTAGNIQLLALASMMRNDPMAAIAAMAGARTLARKMFSPELAATVRQTGRVPLPSLGIIAKTVTAPLANPAYLNTGARVNAANPYSANPYK